MARCGSTQTDDGKPCGNPVRPGERRCWRHGGSRAPFNGRRRPTRANTAPAPTVPSASPNPSIKRSNKKKLALAIASTVTLGAVATTATVTSSADSGTSLNVQVNVDLNQSIAALAKIGILSSSGVKSNGLDCASNATGEIKNFLAQHHCKEFATTTWTTTRNGLATRVTISWVVMPSINLANQYKVYADTPGEGNPPGQSPTFTGLCYSSGQEGNTVWAEQVQPTGKVQTDQQILRAAAPQALSAAYLTQHCNR